MQACVRFRSFSQTPLFNRADEAFDSAESKYTFAYFGAHLGTFNHVCVSLCMQACVHICAMLNSNLPSRADMDLNECFCAYAGRHVCAFVQC